MFFFSLSNFLFASSMINSRWFLLFCHQFWIKKKNHSLCEKKAEHEIRGGVTGGRVSPSCFGKFGHSFLWFWEKISFKLSPILGEDIYKFFFDFGWKYNVFSHFLPFSTPPPPAFSSSRLLWLSFSFSRFLTICKAFQNVHF
jgi:hypothetical protein